MSGIAPGPDPTMEDILASIRRILDEDETAPPAPVATEAPPATGAPSPEETGDGDDVELVLDESMLEEPAASIPAPDTFVGPIHQPPDLEPQTAVDMRRPPAVPADSGRLTSITDTGRAPMSADSDVSGSPAADPVNAPASLLGAHAARVTASSMMDLVRAVTADRGSMVRAAGPSIEDVVREELRPLLKDWLEAHLPPLVERLVRAEIERVVGRATF